MSKNTKAKGSSSGGRKARGRKKAHSPVRPSSSLPMYDGFSLELQSRVAPLRQKVEERSEVLVSVGTAKESPTRRLSSPADSPHSVSGTPSLHELKKSRQSLQLRLKQTELQAALASCRHYPIAYSTSRATKPAAAAHTTPKTTASATSDVSWDDYWDERKQVEKNSEPLDKETDVDEDINERRSHAEWLKQSGFDEAAECVDSNRAVDLSKVRERTRTLKLNATDTAAVLKQVKRINATAARPDAAAADPVTNGKSSPPDRDSAAAAELTSSLEQSGDMETRSASPENPFRLEYFECIGGDADSVDPGKPLPVLALGRQPVGITCMDDVSVVDRNRIRHVTVLSLTALLDTYDLRWKTGRPLKLKSPDAKDLKTKIFGVPLTVLLERDRNLQSNLECPQFFVEVCDFLSGRGLHEEGILRKPGSEARLKKLREELEEVFAERRFSWDGRFPHDCATLLKQFLRELPVALLTEEYLPMFEAIEHLQSRRSQIMVLNLLTLLLPDVHRACLKLLLQTLYLITTFEAKNRMGLSSVAMIIAPNLFRHRPCSDPNNEAKIAARESYIAQLLIVYHQLLFTVPNALLEQLRFLIDTEAGTSRKAKNIKEIKKVLDGAQHRRPVEASASLPSPGQAASTSTVKGVIKIFSPQSSRVSRMLGMSDTTTVSDIVAQFCKRSLNASSPVKPGSAASMESIESLADGKDKQSSASTSSCEDMSADSPMQSRVHRFTPEHTPTFYDIYECSGNIGYRRLPEETIVAEVQRANPAGYIAIIRSDTDDVSSILKSISVI